MPVVPPTSTWFSTSAPRTDTSSSVWPSEAIAAVRIVWLIVSPVTSADAMIVVPSMSPRTISAVRARRRVTLRMPSLKKIRLRTARAPTTLTTSASATTMPTASDSIGMPKSSSTVYLASVATRVGSPAWSESSDTI